jgi:hypothetical protein
LCRTAGAEKTSQLKNYAFGLRFDGRLIAEVIFLAALKRGLSLGCQKFGVVAIFVCAGNILKGLHMVALHRRKMIGDGTKTRI